jgi:Uma2 family endonuclease
MTAVSSKLPVLESGDRLTRVEFHRRYCLRPDIKKAELVEGVAYVASPARASVHGQPVGSMVGWLVVYASRQSDVAVYSDTTVLLDAANEVQPDALLLFKQAPPGGARITEDDYIEGPPQLVVEVAASSASYDLHDKLRAYQRAGVIEYVVWRTLDEAIDWFPLQDGEYVAIQPDERGVIESSVFSGLRLNVARMLAGDLAGVLSQLDRP